MSSFLTLTFWVSFLAATIRVATPLILATLGETFSERSGVLNLGIEGIMMFGAFAGFITVYITKSLWLGVLIATLSGVLFGVFMAFLTVTLGLNQHVSGLGITIFATGLTYYFYRAIIGSPTVPPTINSFNSIAIPLLSKIPILGPVLFNQTIITYFALVAVPVAGYLLFRTNFGLSVRSVGENPEAADAVGINVHRTRYISLIIAGGLMGLSGAFFTLAEFNMFLYDIVAGNGWVSIALVIFANWVPSRVFFGALLFGGVEAIGLRLQGTSVGIPFQVYLMLPYVLTIIVLVATARKASAPSALLKPYRRE
ncbi:MAG: ABC transporter permease [Caldisericaceae bacterium]